MDNFQIAIIGSWVALVNMAMGYYWGRKLGMREFATWMKRYYNISVKPEYKTLIFEIDKTLDA